MLENFGFIHDRIERKVLILYIMRRLPEPVSLEVLADLTMCDDAISYFDATESIAKLVETKHISLDNGLYSITPLGERNGEILEKNLPYPIKQRVDTSTALIKASHNRDTMINIRQITTVDNEYKVAMSLSDGLGEIISMELLAANEKQANDFEKNFRKNAEKIYQIIVEMLLEV